MAGQLLRQVPNLITGLRVLLVVPVCLLILEGYYQPVLWVALLAGISDGIDGWLARKLDCISRIGSILDPLADKVMLVGTYLCLAAVGLLPWWLTAIVVGRDLLIVAGALTYHALYGRYEMEPSNWGKLSTFVQICLALMTLLQQLVPLFPGYAFQIAIWLVAVMAFISGGNYVRVWGGKAINQQRKP